MLDNGSDATLAMSIGGVYLNSVSSKTSIDQLTEAADHVMYGIKRDGKAGMKFEMLSRKAA